MRRTNFLGALLAALVMASPAHSQPAGDQRFGDRLRTSAETIDEAEAARLAHSMAKCISNKRRNASVRMLSAADLDALRSAHRSIWSNDLACYSDFPDGDDRRFASSFDVERGLLAEHLVREADNRVLALPSLPLQAGSYRRDWFAGTGRSTVADEMSACLADTTPSGVRAVLMTTPYTPEEQAAFSALGPMMGKCISAGAKLAGSRQAIRAAVADALYQRLMNPAASMTAAAVSKN